MGEPDLGAELVQRRQKEFRLWRRPYAQTPYHVGIAAAQSTTGADEICLEYLLMLEQFMGHAVSQRCARDYQIWIGRPYGPAGDHDLE